MDVIHVAVFVGATGAAAHDEFPHVGREVSEGEMIDQQAPLVDDREQVRRIGGEFYAQMRPTKVCHITVICGGVDAGLNGVGVSTSVRRARGVLAEIGMGRIEWWADSQTVQVIAGGRSAKP